MDINNNKSAPQSIPMYVRFTRPIEYTLHIQYVSINNEQMLSLVYDLEASLPLSFPLRKGPWIFLDRKSMMLLIRYMDDVLENALCCHGNAGLIPSSEDVIQESKLRNLCLPERCLSVWYMLTCLERQHCMFPAAISLQNSGLVLAFNTLPSTP